MSGAGRQLLTLLWKNAKLQQRKPLTTLFELILPLAFTTILVVVRQSVTSTEYPNGRGFLPFSVNVVPFWPTLLAFTPNTSEPYGQIMNRVSQLLLACNITTNCTQTIPYTVVGFGSEAEMTSNLTRSFDKWQGMDNPLLGGVTFKDSITKDKPIQYEVRLSATARNSLYAVQNTNQNYKLFNNIVGWQTSLTYPLQQTLGPREADEIFGGVPGYFYEGFLQIQRAMDMAIIEHVSGNKSLGEEIETLLWRYPYPPYLMDDFITIIQGQLPVVLMMGYVLAVLTVTRNVVLEKEKKLKEFMKVMGLSNWLHWVTHFIWNLAFFIIPILLLTVLLTGELGHDRVLRESDGLVIFFFLTIYTITMICFAFCISVFFNKGNTAAAVAGILWFIMYLPYFLTQAQYGAMSFAQKIMACFLITTGMGMGTQVIGMWEGQGIGIQWHNMNKLATIDDNFTFMDVIVMMLVDSAICLLIAWYVEAVSPGDEGISQPWHFPFLKSYWFPSKKNDDYERLTNHDDEETMESHADDVTCFESEPTGVDKVIRIFGLKKTFGSGTKAKNAVDGVYLNLFHGEITALLGHNGAGKTTTMSILTGLLPPTDGTAYIDGYDIRTSMGMARKTIGLCPQYNVLFDNLTVKEHLEFYAKLKGSSHIEDEVSKMLLSIKMENKKHALSKTLSGGMKRKLSVGIALIGGSKVVILDEPTAGMDPSARRGTWDLIQRERAGRSIILTTHYMEEADLLGDRIAIMADGKVKCCGSSIFLKNRYGAGYHLTVVMHQGRVEAVDDVTSMLQSHVPTAKLDGTAGVQATFTLPQSGVKKFEKMFRELEQSQDSLGVDSFGASVTTMEEVFLRVGEQHSKASHDEGNEESGVAAPVDLTGFSLIDPERNTGAKLVFQQFKAVLWKKVLHTMRNWKVLLPQLMVASMMTIVLLFINKLIPTTGSRSANFPLVLNLQPFHSINGNPVVTFAFNKTASLSPSWLDKFSVETLAKHYESQFDSETKKININEDFVNNPFWKPMHQSSYWEDFLADIFGVLNYENITAGLDINSFNAHNIISGYFQNGDVISFYLDGMKKRYESGKIPADLWKQFQMAIPYLNQTDFQFKNKSSISMIGLFNNQPFHSPAIALSAINNGLYRYLLGTNKSNTNIRIETINHPLPTTANDKIAEYRNSQLLGYNTAFTIALAMSFVMSTFVIFVIKERVCKAKHLQYICGVHPLNFWSANYLWDIINYIGVVIPIIITWWAYDISALIDDQRWFLVFILMMSYGASSIPFLYINSFGFEEATVGYVKLSIINILLGCGLMSFLAVLEIPQFHLQHAHDVLEWILICLSPHLAYAQGLRDFYDNWLSASTCRPLYDIPGFCDKLPENSCCPDCESSGLCLRFTDHYLDFNSPGSGRYVVVLLIQSVVFCTALILHEMGYLRQMEYCLRTRHTFVDEDTITNGNYQPDSLTLVTNLSGESSVSATSEESDADSTVGGERYEVLDDTDVIAEQHKLKTHSLKQLSEGGAIVILNRIMKKYDQFVSVKGLSLCVENQECFGLLGVNGAGKTTTFKMLTGDEDITDGNAYIAGHSVKTHMKQARSSLSYCPQFDALIDQMTGDEMIEMFARLRGVPEEHINAMADQLMSVLALEPHRSKMTSFYSGGNKRKLSIALALLGRPPVVMLDEPTAGIDPVARRLVWRVLAAVREGGTPIILTSHGMDECEALCTRLAIMVDGQFKCLGSPQHLKTKFGTGYTLLIKLKRRRRVPSAVQTIRRLFPGAVVKDVHQNLVHFHVPSYNLPYSKMFGAVEKTRTKLRITDYSISQTTLEQIFLNFSRGTIPGDSTRP